MTGKDHREEEEAIEAVIEIMEIIIMKGGITTEEEEITTEGEETTMVERESTTIIIIIPISPLHSSQEIIHLHLSSLLSLRPLNNSLYLKEENAGLRLQFTF